MKKVNVALIGYGHLGKWHADKASKLENSNLVAIVEKFKPNAEAAKQTYPHVKVVEDIREIIDEVDAALIVTPTSMHYELCDFLIKKNKHVFCEKPLCAFYDETLKLEKILNKDKIIQVGHSERCHKAWEILEPEFKKINSAFTLKINRVAAFKGRATDVDVVQDLMIHDIDLITYLTKKTPIKVSATGNKIRTSKWDSVTAIFTYEDSSVAVVTSSRNHVKEIRDFELTHDGGTIYVDLFLNELSVAPSTQYEDGTFVKTEKYEKRDHLYIEQERFFDSILNNKKPMVSFEDGKKAVYIVEKVLEALDTKKEVVISE